MQVSSLFMADIIPALRAFFPKWKPYIFKRRVSAFLVSDYTRLAVFPWIDQPGDLLCVLLRRCVGGCWACALTPKLFQFETSEQPWIRTSFLCSYLNMLLTQYSVFWYSNIHFLSISFQKWRKTAKHNLRTCPHFSLWESFWYLTLIFCLGFQRTLHLWVCPLKPHLRKIENKKTQKPLLIRFTFQITLMPDGLTNESPYTSFSVVQLWVIIQFDFWDIIRTAPNERLL